MVFFVELQGYHFFAICPSGECFSEIYAVLDRLSILQEIRMLIPAINDCLVTIVGSGPLPQHMPNVGNRKEDSVNNNGSVTRTTLKVSPR
jgi:hypothetical protein